MRANWSISLRFQVVVATLASCLGAATWQVLSDERPATDAPHKIPVALLDVTKVFKQASEFNEKMNRIKAEIEKFGEEMRARTAEIEKLRPKDTGSAPSSGEATEKATKLAAAVQADVTAKKQALLIDEARVYFETYSAMQKVVDQICRTRNVGVVLKFTLDPIDPADRASVLQGVNNPIVYSAIPDLTADVVAALNGEKL